MRLIIMPMWPPIYNCTSVFFYFRAEISSHGVIVCNHAASSSLIIVLFCSPPILVSLTVVYRLISMELPLPSILGLALLPPSVPAVLLELTLSLLRLYCLSSLGSLVTKPDCLENKFKISVKLTTPVSFPLILAPGKAAAEILGNAGLIGGLVPIRPLDDGGAAKTLGADILGALAGVAGVDGDGDALSVTHIR